MSIHIGSATLRDIVVGTKIKGMSGGTVWKPRIKLIKYIEVIYKKSTLSANKQKSLDNPYRLFTI